MGAYNFYSCWQRFYECAPPKVDTALYSLANCCSHIWICLCGVSNKGASQFVFNSTIITKFDLGAFNGKFMQYTPITHTHTHQQLMQN